MEHMGENSEVHSYCLAKFLPTIIQFPFAINFNYSSTVAISIYIIVVYMLVVSYLIFMILF